jgi:hypothetical protein
VSNSVSENSARPGAAVWSALNSLKPEIVASASPPIEPLLSSTKLMSVVRSASGVGPLGGGQF